MAGHQQGERLTAADASNVVLDAADQVNAFLLAGLLGVGGFVHDDGTLDLDQLRADIAARFHDPAAPELSRFSERVGTRQGRLVWEPCEPDLAWHVRLTEPVHGLAGLADLCASLMVRGLPADRPGWELLVVPGTAIGGPGVVFRAHHAIADGVAGVRLAERLFGAAPIPSPAEPDEGVVTRNASVDRGTVEAAVSSGKPQPQRQPPQHRARWRRFATGVVRVAAMARRAVPRTVLLGSIGPHRGVGFTETELSSLAEASRHAGGTINDALLAGVVAATAAALRAGRQPVPAVLPASVPVALSDRAGSGNAVGVMVVGLPTDEPDIGARITRIAESTRAAKAEARAAGTYELTRTRWGSRLFAWLARRQRFIAMFVTNVRGPAATLVVGGAPLEHAWPVTPIQGNVRLGVAALSYRGRLACTVHVDASALDASVVARTLGDEFSNLVATLP